MKIKVLIADDNSFIREGMKIILSSFDEFEVVGSVEDGAEAVAFCQNNPVDIALMDVRMPNMNGVEATRLIIEQTNVKPIILTTFDDDEFIMDAIKYGARGYLLKNNSPERIRDAIKSVYNDHNVLQDVVLEKLKSSLMSATPVTTSTPVTLTTASTANSPATQPNSSHPSIDRSQFTDRELDVMAQIASGRSNKEISKKLFISEGTIANYITSILNKTGLEHRTQIAIYYLTGEVHMSNN
ncbi:MAG: response regulator transcription factor [Candidatus Cohnella colombiensis]|uniref:Response regulator transcription factor n=1 Tax=Candidatus Cohnella colombiensis TaxID=3121368 RepID=A0AA95JD12_9BACL|nr:MAG: response regulator transcription factor [Cohnella sp.]